MKKSSLEPEEYMYGVDGTVHCINHKQRHIGYEAVDWSIQVGGDTHDCSEGTSAKT